ncbi:MAG: peptide chain release factor N(5)-glutamine methyltransferase [Bdellovibrionales bacterium]|nr:peptide chain release factor N(5)-glutamine methyltransferase [Bdellovibrionales bacterium]
MTIGYFINSLSADILSGVSDRLDIELLLSKILCCDRAYLYIHWDQELKKKQVKQFQTLYHLRKTGMPLAYILGQKEFYGYEFTLQPGVFIPRPETETLVSAVVSQWNSQETLKIIDFGCGSGCIGLSLLACFPRAFLIAIDINKKAIQVGEINARKLGVANRVTFLNRDIRSLQKKDIEPFLGKKGVDIIVTNPPYIAFNDGRVEEEVVSFEPPEALFSDENGLYHIRTWSNIAARLLKPTGAYLFEIGKAQDISRVEFNNSLRKTAEFRDGSHIVRILQFQKCHG